MAYGKITKKQMEILECIKQAILDKGYPPTVRELCEIGDKYLEEHGVSLSGEQNDPNQIYAAFPPHWGHGIGMTWERPWFIHEETMELKAGMFIAVEKALYKEGVGTVTYEQNLLVTENGSETLTTSEKVWLA